jgi:hypothetical protein
MKNKQQQGQLQQQRQTQIPFGVTTKKIGNGNSRSLRATTERTGNRNYDSDCNCGDNSEAKTGILRCAQDDDC